MALVAKPSNEQRQEALCNCLALAFLVVSSLLRRLILKVGSGNVLLKRAFAASGTARDPGRCCGLSAGENGGENAASSKKACFFGRALFQRLQGGRVAQPWRCSTGGASSFCFPGNKFYQVMSLMDLHRAAFELHALQSWRPQHRPGAPRRKPQHAARLRKCRDDMPRWLRESTWRVMVLVNQLSLYLQLCL